VYVKWIVFRVVDIKTDSREISEVRNRWEIFRKHSGYSITRVVYRANKYFITSALEKHPD